MKTSNTILNRLNEAEISIAENWYFKANDAEKILLEMRNVIQDEELVKQLEEMIVNLNTIRMEGYKILKGEDVA